VNTALFRKEAMARFQRTDAPGAIVDIAPPRTVALFGVMAVLFLTLVGLAWFGRAPIVAEGRGVLRPDRPPIAMLAPFTGTVLEVHRGVREDGHAGDVLLELDAHTARDAHERCAAVVRSDQSDLASLEQRLASWNDEQKRDRDASTALVLLAQVRAQREKLSTATQQCESLASVLNRSRVVFPVDARVADVAVAAGSQVREGDVLATLEPAGAHLVGYLELPEPYRSEIAPGQTVRLKFDALPFNEWGAGAGRVTRVLDGLPSGVKLDTLAAGGVAIEMSLDAMPHAADPPRRGMTFTGSVVLRKMSILSLLLGGGSSGGDDA
jgi:multidrug resistance efflux pump